MGKRVQRKAIAHVRAREGNVPPLWAQPQLGVGVNRASLYLRTKFGEKEKNKGAVPDEGVDLFNGMLNLVVCVGGLDAQFKDYSVNLVNDKRYFDALLDGMPQDHLGSNHEL